MPPRKSTASTAAATPGPPENAIGDASILSTATTGTTEPKSPTTQKSNRQSTGGEVESEKKRSAKNDDIGIDDLLLPRTLTSRLSRGTLPPNTSIQRDALLALTKSATVFISYLAHTANNLTSRKTIQSQDILEALREAELWNVPIYRAGNGAVGGGGTGVTLGDRVKAEVEKWEGEVRGKRKGYRDRVKARESGGVNDTSGLGDGGVDDDDERQGPMAKRARRDSADEREDTNMLDDGEGDGDVDEDAAAAQLQGEEAEAAANGDATETDPEAVDEDDDEEDEADEDEGDGEDDDDDNDDDEDAARRDRDLNGGLDGVEEDGRSRTALAPNGRVEVGSDEESD